MADRPIPTEGILLTHFIVSGDVERSRRFYSEVLGGETVMEGEPSMVALANISPAIVQGPISRSALTPERDG
jgi:hypothetical protein